MCLKITKILCMLFTSSTFFLVGCTDGVELLLNNDFESYGVAIDEGNIPGIPDGEDVDNGKYGDYLDILYPSVSLVTDAHVEMPGKSARISGGIEFILKVHDEVPDYYQVVWKGYRSHSGQTSRITLVDASGDIAGGVEFQGSSVYLITGHEGTPVNHFSELHAHDVTITLNMRGLKSIGITVTEGEAGDRVIDGGNLELFNDKFSKLRSVIVESEFTPYVLDNIAVHSLVQ